MQSYFKLHVARVTLFIPLCGCQRRHRYHSVNDIVVVTARSQRHRLKIPKVMDILIYSKLADNAAPCFLPLFLEAKKTVTTTLRGVRCTIGAGRLPRWTTTALRSYTWWLSPKCIEGKRSENVRLRETTASRIHLRVTRNAWSARHVSMKERNSYNLDSLQILERFLQKEIQNWSWNTGLTTRASSLTAKE